MKIIQSNPKALVIIGPSGSGKSTIIASLVGRKRLNLTPTWTTRPKRHYETGEQLDHVFVDDEAFDAKVKDNFFYEEIKLFGLPYRYGLPRINFDEDQGIHTIMLRSFLLNHADSHIDNYSVYQIERPYKSIETHMHLRKEIDGDIGDRLVRYQTEVQHGREQADRVIVNDGKVETAIEEFERFLLADFDQVPGQK